MIPGSGRSLGEGNDYPLQYSYLENPMDRGAWWAIVHGLTKSGTELRLTLYHTTALMASQLISPLLLSVLPRESRLIFFFKLKYS